MFCPAEFLKNGRAVCTLSEGEECIGKLGCLTYMGYFESRARLNVLQDFVPSASGIVDGQRVSGEGMLVTNFS